MLMLCCDWLIVCFVWYFISYRDKYGSSSVILSDIAKAPQEVIEDGKQKLYLLWLHKIAAFNPWTIFFNVMTKFFYQNNEV